MLLPALLAVAVPLAWEARAADVGQAAAEAPSDEASLIPLLAQLGDDSFLVREKAMEQLWRMGSRALPALRKVEAGADPEASDRARELILYISAGVLFDSPGEVKELVLKFSQSDVDEKIAILNKLLRLEQWRQVLYLSRLEKNPGIRDRMSSLVRKVGLHALRQAIIRDDDALAGEILDLLGDDLQSMFMRAWYECHRGNLGQELEKAAAITGKQGSLWRMSLHRASGNTKAAIQEAQAAGEQQLANAWRVLEGDAMPWLRNSDPDQGRDAIYEMGCAIQVSRLQGKQKKLQADLDALLKLADDSRSALRVIAGLGANGYRDEALVLLRKHYPDAAFDYYDAIEMPQLALEILGIPGEAKPPYTDWVRKFTAEAIEEDDEDLYGRLTMLAGFLAARGEHEHALPVLEPMMTALEEEGADVWFKLLAHMRSYGLAAEAVHFIKHRGNEHDEADAGVRFLLDHMDDESRALVWEHLKKRNKRDINRALDELVLLSGLVTGSGDNAAGLHKTLLEEAGQMGPDDQQALLSALYEFCVSRNDLASASEMADRLAHLNETWAERKNHLDENLMRWAKVEPVFAEKAKNKPHDFHNLIKWHIALRKLGRDDDAGEAYRKAMLLSFGEAAILNYWGLLLNAAGFEKEAAGLWIQAAVSAHATDSEDLGYDYAMLYLADHNRQLYRDGEWKRAAAIGEVVSRIYMRGISNESNLLSVLKIRHHSEFSQGVLLLRQGRRQEGIERLDMARRMIPGDGLLADDFFPLIRKENLGEIYDQWFEESYRQVEAACKLYPGSHNSHNTAAWLAARAVRKLEAAHAHAEQALKMRPRQGAYLDTMAEVWFARGERDKALEWSRQAIDASLSSADGNPRSEGYVFANFQQLTKQYEYFKNSPLPGEAR